MTQAIKIHHEIGDVTIIPKGTVDRKRLADKIRNMLNEYAEEARMPASVLHQEIKDRYGDYYISGGYNLRLYRKRAGLTQTQLAERARMLQHHLSEIENNKRTLGKANAMKLARILDCDYRKLL